MLYRCNDFDTNGRPFYDDLLYDKTQKIHLSVGGHDEQIPLNVKLCLTGRNGFVDEKVLKIIITDEKNPLFLYTSEVNSEIYTKLRHKLGLLVDFAQFPNQFVNLLAQCDEDSRTKYSMILEEVTADPYDLVDGRCVLFKVTEINRFQRLCLVALHVVPGSETEVNALMARNVASLKKQLELLELKYKSAEERTATAEENMKMKQFEVQQMKNQVTEQICLHRQKADEEVEALKREYEMLKNDCDRRIKHALANQEDKHRVIVSGLEVTVESHRAEASVLKNLNGKLELELENRKEHLEKFNNDIKILQDEILKAESKIGRLEADAKEKNAFIVNLKQRFSHLEKDRDEKDKLAKKLNSLLENSESKKTHYRTELEKKERNFATLAKDLLKANEIIAKMNKEVGVVRLKLSEHLKEAAEKDKTLEEWKTKLSKIEKIDQERNEKIQKLEEQNKQLENDLKEARESIEAKEEIIRKNERIIGWLNDIVTKQDGVSRPQSSISKYSNISSITESVSSKVNSIDKKSEQALPSKVDKSLPGVKKNIPKTKPIVNTFRNY